MLFRSNKDAFGKVYNVATGNNFTVNFLYQSIGDILGINHPATYREPRQGDIRDSLADISRAQQLLGYNPTQQFMDGRPQYQTTLCLAPTAASEVRKWKPTTAAENLEQPEMKGWVILNVRFDSEEEAVFVILGFGARAEVLKPESLRKRVAAELSAMVDRMSQKRA